MPLSVIGAGISRTGTFSLKLALEQLGVGRCYHMSEVVKNPSFASYWEEITDGKAPNWEKIFQGYAATTDHPPCFYYKQLALAFPEAKIILSTRDPDDWFDSIQATILSQERRAVLGDSTEERAANPIARMLDKVFPYDKTQWHDRSYMVSFYHRHNDEVRRTIPKDRLLEYEVSQGWQPLCSFLGFPVPEVPFPNVNSREEFRARDKAFASQLSKS